MDAMEKLNAALADRYTIERELGQGGMATVYLARDVRHDRPVAVKVLRPELAASLGTDRFLREIRTTAQLTHPHILPLHDSGEAAGFLYYVMPYMEGESLRDRLTREKQLPLEDALRITREVADALGYAHAVGLVHRDIKPENILFEAGHAVVSDFGIARAVSAAGGARLTETGLSIGTPAYMSPEQAAGSHDVDGRSDLYSLGCVLYEMLSGETPYTGPTPQAILAKKLSEPLPRISVVRETTPPVVEAALVKALARTPADRFASAAEFLAALMQAPTGVVPGRRRQRMLFGVGLAVAGVVAVAALALWVRSVVQQGARGSPVHRQVTFANAELEALSPDGRYIVYSTSDSAYTRNMLSVLDLESNSTLKVADSVAGWIHARWAPTGDRLLIKEPHRVVEIPRVGFAGQVLVSVPEDRDIEGAAFAPDGRSWVRVERYRDTSLFIVRQSSQTIVEDTVRTTGINEEGMRSTAFAPDGRSWVRIENHRGPTFFIVRHFGQPAVEDTTRQDGIYAWAIDWSRRGGWLIRAESWGSKDDLVLRLNPNGGKTDTLFARHHAVGWVHVSMARWAPRGDAALVVLDEELVRVGHGRREPETLLSGIRVSSFDVSADGRTLAYGQVERLQGKALVLTFTQGAPPTTNTVEVSEGTLWTGEAAISPDGATLAVARGPLPWTADLYLVPAKGGEARRATFTNGGIYAIQWAPDSKRISYLVSATGSLDLYELATGQARRLTANVNSVRMGTTRYPSAWLDSTTVSYYDSTSHHTALDIRTGTGTRLPDNWWYLVPSPDGRQAAAIDSNELLVIDRAIGQARVVARLPRYAVPTVWSQDGRIAFVTMKATNPNFPDRIMAVPAAGGTQRLLYDVRQCYPGSISMSTDLRTVACPAPGTAWGGGRSRDVWVAENFTAFR